MLVSFEITMPNVGSWNGIWTSAKNAHFAFKNLNKNDVHKLLGDNEFRNFHYNFGDGWCANIKVKRTDSLNKKLIERVNSGFMCYDWMINSILKHDKIIIENDK